MALTVYAFCEHPHAFAVTGVGAPLEECTFLLDFNRPLEKVRQLFGYRVPIGITVGLLVPVVHIGQARGQFVIGVDRGEPYFIDLPKLWKAHSGSTRSIHVSGVDGLEIIVNFATHFPEDCS